MDNRTNLAPTRRGLAAVAALAAITGSARAAEQAARHSTFVLVHGAWHGGWCWERVATRLIERGHRVHAPTLTGLGERSHLISPASKLDTDIADTTNKLTAKEEPK